jgi:hypothetical protein
MRRLAFLLSLPVLFAGLLSAPAFADKRVALVVGNSAYRSVDRLENPENDARLLAETLRGLGFALVGGGAQLDLDKAGFDRTVQEFGAQLAGADVGLFYFAGHGVQVRGENYLVPVDANPTKEADVDFQMLDTNLVLRQMEGAGTRLNIVILDACRNNPFGGRGLVVGRARDAESTRMRGMGGGLAQMQAPEGTLISFATQPGNVAQDGAGRNSPYARALADTIRKPGLGIFDAFNQVGLQVKRATPGAQQPWVSSSPIDGSFYFAAQEGATTAVAAATPPSSPSPNQPAAQSRLAALPPPNDAQDVRRFDGIWISKLVCDAAPAGVLGVTVNFIGRVKDGVFHSENGERDKPGFATFDGTIEPDGSAAFVWSGLSADPKRSLNHLPQGTRFSWTLTGKFENANGSVIKYEGRTCKIAFAKR